MASHHEPALVMESKCLYVTHCTKYFTAYFSDITRIQPCPASLVSANQSQNGSKLATEPAATPSPTELYPPRLSYKLAETTHISLLLRGPKFTPISPPQNNFQTDTKESKDQRSILGKEWDDLSLHRDKSKRPIFQSTKSGIPHLYLDQNAPTSCEIMPDNLFFESGIMADSDALSCH